MGFLRPAKHTIDSLSHFVPCFRKYAWVTIFPMYEQSFMVSGANSLKKTHEKAYPIAKCILSLLAPLYISCAINQIDSVESAELPAPVYSLQLLQCIEQYIELSSTGTDERLRGFQYAVVFGVGLGEATLGIKLRHVRASKPVDVQSRQRFECADIILTHRSSCAPSLPVRLHTTA